MIKAYALNKNGKIELTIEELQKLIDEAVEEGTRLAGQPSIVYRECPIQTIPVVKKVEIGDTPPFVSPITCQTGTATVGNDIQERYKRATPAQKQILKDVYGDELRG